MRPYARNDNANKLSIYTHTKNHAPVNAAVARRSCSIAQRDAAAATPPQPADDTSLTQRCEHPAASQLIGRPKK